MSLTFTGSQSLTAKCIVLHAAPLALMVSPQAAMCFGTQPSHGLNLRRCKLRHIGLRGAVRAVGYILGRVADLDHNSGVHHCRQRVSLQYELRTGEATVLASVESVMAGSSVRLISRSDSA